MRSCSVLGESSCRAGLQLSGRLGAIYEKLVSNVVLFDWKPMSRKHGLPS